MIDTKTLEKFIIKGCLLDKQYLVTIASVFKKEYFDDPILTQIFSALKDHVNTYNCIMPRDALINSISMFSVDDIDTILKEIEAYDFDIAKNYEYLFNESNNYLKDKAVKDAILASVDIIDSGTEDRQKIRHLIEDALCKDLKIDIGLDYFGNAKERLKRIFNKSDIRIPTGYPLFDEMLNGGFPPFTLSVGIAKVHGWKSSMLANFATRQVLLGYNVVLCSLEMAEDAFAQRFDSLFTNLDINKIYMSEDKKRELIRKLSEIKSYPELGKLFIKQFPTGAASVIDIKRYLRELVIRGHKPDIVYVDYINIMKPTYTSRGDMYSDVKRIAEELRALSFEFECPVVSVSQLNREGTFVSFEEVDFNYIAESMGVPATADFMMILGIDEDKLVYESELMGKIVKNRLGGRIGEVLKFYYDSRTLKLYDESELDTWLNDARITGDDRNVAEVISERQERPSRGRR